jgi:hypothetical protein
MLLAVHEERLQLVLKAEKLEISLRIEKYIQESNVS